MPLVLDLRPLGNRVAHSDEQVLESFPGLGDDVAVAEAATPVELGQVEALGFEHHGTCPGGHFDATVGDQAFDLGPHLVDPATRLLALVGLHVAQLAAYGGQQGLPPQQFGVDGGEGVEV